MAIDTSLFAITSITFIFMLVAMALTLIVGFAECNLMSRFCGQEYGVPAIISWTESNSNLGGAGGVAGAGLGVEGAGIGAAGPLGIGIGKVLVGPIGEAGVIGGIVEVCGPVGVGSVAPGDVCG